MQNPDSAGRHRRGRIWVPAMLVVVAAAVVLLVVGLAIAARAATPPPVIPGAVCSQVGAFGTHGGQAYRCEQRPGETCPHWHWVYNPSVPVTSWPPHSPCPCGPSPSLTASPSPTMSPSATAQPIGSVSPTGTPASPSPTPSRPPGSVVPPPVSGGLLPTTGPSTKALVVAGLVVLVVGVGARLLARRRGEGTEATEAE